MADQDSAPPGSEGAGAPPESTPAGGTPEGESEGIVPDDTPPAVSPSASYIIQRQKEQIEKLRSRQPDDEDGAGGEDDEATPGKIAQEVQKAIRPLMDTFAGQAKEQELQSFFTSNPDARKLEKTIRAWKGHEAYASVPPQVIYNHLTSGMTQKKQMADTEAALARGAGTSRRPAATPKAGSPTADEVENMSEEEFEKTMEQAKSGKFVPKE